MHGKFTQTYKLLLYFVNKLAEILFLNLICSHVMLIKLTLTGLSLFFKFLPISNTGDSLCPKLGSFSDMEYLFYHLAYRDPKVPKRLVGLNQMQCSPSFDWNCGKQNDPTACWYQLHPRFQVLQQGKCLRYPPERVGGVTETTIPPIVVI